MNQNDHRIPMVLKQLAARSPLYPEDLSIKTLNGDREIHVRNKRAFLDALVIGGLVTRATDKKGHAIFGLSPATPAPPASPVGIGVSAPKPLTTDKAIALIERLVEVKEDLIELIKNPSRSDWSSEALRASASNLRAFARNLELLAEETEGE